ncbi:MAG: hypothetical protein E7314_01505 [Clostridiales bacterium]|nr:hypothetical protein [Clostridiales bacterium]
MKFSKEKKAKMRKQRQKKIAERSKYLMGRCIERWEYDETIKMENVHNIQEINAFYEKYKEPSYNIVDRTRIDGDIYLLGESMCCEGDFSEMNKVVIFKVVPHFKYSKLSSRRLLEKKDTFETYKIWEMKSYLEISNEGKISYTK